MWGRPRAMRKNDRFSIIFNNPEDTEGHYSISMLHELADAYMGILQHPNGPPIACYNHAIAAHILSHKWRVTKKVAINLIDYLAQNARGDSAPAFLKRGD
jgi:hypothetical protein